MSILCKILGHAWHPDAAEVYSVYDCERCGHHGSGDEWNLRSRIRLWLYWRRYEAGLRWSCLREWWKCSECGGRFGEHNYDEFDHIIEIFAERIAEATLELLDTPALTKPDAPAVENPPSKREPERVMDLYLKIKRAAINGKSLRLTADDCYQLYFQDEAIRAAADNLEGWHGGPRKTCGTYEQQRDEQTSELPKLSLK